MAMTEMAEIQPYVDSSVLLGDSEALQARARGDGYLVFRDLVPRDRTLELRRLILELCEQHGWLADGAPLMDGIRRPEVLISKADAPRWRAFYRDVLCIREFHAMAMEPSVQAALSQVFGEQAITHSRNICRVMFPAATEYTTPPHQDFLYIGGTRDTWTCWMPLGDCPKELGGIALVPGSHEWGFLEVEPGRGAGGNQVRVPEDATWVLDELGCGDALFFHSHTIHQGLDNATEDRLRISVDYRYQPISHPLREASMTPHMNGFGLTWDDIYRDWPEDDPLRYYWKDWDLDYVE
jgi:phytanoyl-CoA dioxygenase PhyH